jgi:uncharacterized membrane protein/protein-disulfide isomerase
MSRLAHRLLLGFAGLGLGASLASTVVHYRLLRQPGYTSFCDVNTTVSCTEAYLSRFGSVLGVPVALIGALFFGLLLVLMAAAPRGGPARENVPAYVFALSTLGLAVSLYLGYVSLFVLRAVCLLCVATHAAVIGLFVTSGIATSFPMTTLPRRAARDLRTLLASPRGLAISLVFVVASAAAVGSFPREPGADGASGQAASATEDRRSEFERWYEAQPRVQVPVPNEGAAVLIVKFNDYQCPPCRQTYMEYGPILNRYGVTHPGAVKLVTKDFPLDPECNASTPNGQHLAACEAAVAVRLARRHDRADTLERHLFTNQEMLSPAWVREAAREVGGVQDFGSEYARTLEAVKADISLGNLLGVAATPTFFINGVKVQGGLQPQFFDAAIAYELKKAGP